MQGFDLKLCTGLSHSVVATGAIGSCIYGLLQRSPADNSKTLLNFDIALTLIPAMLFGVSFVSDNLACLRHCSQHPAVCTNQAHRTVTGSTHSSDRLLCWLRCRVCC